MALVLGLVRSHWGAHTMCHALLRAIWTITDFSIHAEFRPQPMWVQGHVCSSNDLWRAKWARGIFILIFIFVFVCIEITKWSRVPLGKIVLYLDVFNPEHLCSFWCYVICHDRLSGSLWFPGARWRSTMTSEGRCLLDVEPAQICYTPSESICSCTIWSGCKTQDTAFYQ